MKNSKLYLFPMAFLLLSALAACGQRAPKNTKLSSPNLIVNEEKNGLTWAPVDGAISYSIKVNDDAVVTVEEPGYAFEEEADSYVVQVVANASNEENRSDPARFEYSTIYTTISPLTYSAGTISWADVQGVGVEYTLDDGQPVAVQGSSISATRTGIYTVRALSGFNEETHKYFFKNPLVLSSRSILIQGTQASGITLEDGEYDTDTDLQERYVAKKYDSGWVDTTATIVLDEDNPFSTGNCIKANIWHHGAWFKWTRNFSCDGRIESLSFFVKGQAATRFAVSFDITEDIVMAGMNLKGVYATYMVQPAPLSWTEYKVSTDDPAWTVNFNGSTYPFATVQSLLNSYGYTVQSLGDFFPYFGSYSIKAMGEYKDGGPTTCVWFDDIKLGVEPTQTIIDQKFDVAQGQYAFKSNQINAGTFTYVKEGGSKVEFRQDNNLVTIPVTTSISQQEKAMTITSTATGLDFVAKITSTDGGETFNLVSVTGNAASYIQGMQLEKCQILYDFENFTATGVGYDQSHTDETAWTGLRKEFYSDYYSGGSGSPVGGSGWSMMGSSDYLELSTSVAHTGSKSMRLKYNASNQMRFLTFNLYPGNGPAYQKGAYLSMWVRANSTRSNDIKLKAFYISKVEPATQSSCTEVEVVIPQDENHGWVEVKVPLSASKTYYGFGIQPMKNSGSSAGDGQYFYVDNIAIYNNISPFVNATA